MSTKPDNSQKPDLPPGEAAHVSAKSTQGAMGTPKPAPTIDLPPEALSRVEEEAAPAAAPETVTSIHKSRTPMLVPALCGLLAGLAGGAGISQFMPPRAPASAIEARLQAIETKPAIPQALTDRLKATETALADATTKETALRGEIEQLARALRSEGETRAQGIAALAARPAEPAGAVPLTGDAAGEVERLRTRLGAMEQTMRALPEAIGAVGARSETASGKLEALSPRLDQLSARFEQISPRIGALSEQVSAIARTATGANRQDALARATALVTASAGFADLFRSKKPYEAALAPLTALGMRADMLAPLQPFAKTGAPDGATLLSEIKALRIKPATAAPAQGDLVERLKSGALALIEVRRTGEITGTDDDAHLARSEQALQRNEFTTAASLIDKLSAERKPAYAAFADRLKARIAAESGLEKLLASAQSALSEAAQALAK